MKKVKISKQLKEVFEKLIPIYEKAIDTSYTFTSRKKYYIYLCYNNLDVGICWASISILNTVIDEEMDNTGYKLGFHYAWFELPANDRPIKENKSLLQKRVDIMKELLNQQ